MRDALPGALASRLRTALVERSRDPRADLVARFQGGNNAGHTLIVDGHKTVLHLVPSGILQPGTVNLIGPSVVVDPRVLVKEL